MKGAAAAAVVLLLGVWWIASFSHQAEAFHSNFQTRPTTVLYGDSLLDRLEATLDDTDTKKLRFNDNWLDHKEEYWRYELPTELQRYQRRSLRRIQCGFGENNAILDVYVIGTNHVFDESAKDVRLLLETVCPDLIMIELCSERFLTYWSSHFGIKGFETTQEDASQASSEKGTVSKPRENMGWRKWTRPWQRKRRDEDPLFSRFERNSLDKEAEGLSKLAEYHGSVKGGEMLAAFQYWNETHSAANQQHSSKSTNHPLTTSPMLLLGDRSIILTELRTMENMKWREKALNFLLEKVGPRAIRRVIKLVVISGLIDAVLKRTGFGLAKAVSKGVLSLSVIGAGLGVCLYVQSRPLRLLLRLYDDGCYTPETKSMIRDFIINENSKESYGTKLYSGDVSACVSESFMCESEKQVIIRERDTYMACKLFDGCQVIEVDDDEDKRYTAVAIVGAAHVPGICENFMDLVLEKETPEEILPALVKSERLDQGEEEISKLINGNTIPQWGNWFNLYEPKFEIPNHECAKEL